MPKRFDIDARQVVMHTDRQICASIPDILASPEFLGVVARWCDYLAQHEAPVIGEMGLAPKPGGDWSPVARLLRVLAETPLDEVATIAPDLAPMLEHLDREDMLDFVEGFYTYWRSLDRYMVLHAEPGPSGFDRRPYRAFNQTVEQFGDTIRAAYRDIAENVTGDHPRIYRQVAAGCDVALIALEREDVLPERYRPSLGGIPFIRQVWLTPPFIIDPPMNKRTGSFQRVAENPLAGLELDPGSFLCFPAQVGPLTIFVYFHQDFIGLGSSLANLFELATDAQIAEGPDALYVFGAPPEAMQRFGDSPLVFHEDEAAGLLAAAVPLGDHFGYFGYLKKMILTLHNIVMMKRGRMPYHGAMVRIALRNGRAANVLVIGDTATGKSETLEAFRILGDEYIRSMAIVADDMGSLEIAPDGRVLGYGTETGAFIRLDDLEQGYVFTQVDRAVVMSPQRINARVVVPVATMNDVLRGWPVDFLLYANNYENIDEGHAVLEAFKTPDEALEVFRQGAAMTKGTTTSTGLVHNYFANIFGPPAYREEHDVLADKVFRAAFEAGVFVGQLRTRLGIGGCESSGPQEAARVLFEAISARDKA